MDFAILRVSTPDGQVREYPLDVAQVFIGRAEANRVVIDHVSVSRRHARLQFVNGQVLLEDLQSATGTYVSGQRLAPGTPRAITVGDALRFGDCQASLVAAGPADPGPATGETPSSGTTAATRTEQAIEVSIASPTAPVAPGSAGTATVTVQNRGRVPDTVQISIHGLPESWVRITRPTIQLLPDARDEVVVIIQPPREPSSLAGQHEFAAAATSLHHNVEVRALGRVVVQPMGSLSIEVRPAHSRKHFTATVENQSNSPAVVGMAATDPEDVVAVTFQPPQIELQPGETATVQLDARHRKGGFFGKESHHLFQTEAKADSRSATASAELRYRPPWLLWRWVALAVLLVALAAGGWFAYSAFAGDDDDEARGNVDETATATVTTAPDETPTTPATEETPEAGMAVGSTAVVTNSPEGDCLFIRPYHTRQSSDPRSRPISTICDGTRVTIIGGRVENEGYYWYQVRTEDGVEGWSAEGLVSGGPRFLTPAQ